MEPFHKDLLGFPSHYFRGTNAKITLLLNLAEKAEHFGFDEYSQYLLQNAFNRLKRMLEGLEQKLERTQQHDHSSP